MYVCMYCIISSQISTFLNDLICLEEMVMKCENVKSITNVKKHERLQYGALLYSQLTPTDSLSIAALLTFMLYDYYASLKSFSRAFLTLFRVSTLVLGSAPT